MYTLFLAGTVPSVGATRALQHSPDAVRDPFLDDGPAPGRVTQLYFDSMAALEAAAARVGVQADAEAMQVHRFAVPHAWQRTPARYCTYLVAYEGPADDEPAWLAYYLEHHPPLMARLPNIRELEVYTPVDWRCPRSLRRVRHLQRNKVAFDSAADLAAALGSSVRHEMRADFTAFPPYRGRVAHYAMTTQVVGE